MNDASLRELFQKGLGKSVAWWVIEREHELEKKQRELFEKEARIKEAERLRQATLRKIPISGDFVGLELFEADFHRCDPFERCNDPKKLGRRAQKENRGDQTTKSASGCSSATIFGWGTGFTDFTARFRADLVILFASFGEFDAETLTLDRNRDSMRNSLGCAVKRIQNALVDTRMMRFRFKTRKHGKSVGKAKSEIPYGGADKPELCVKPGGVGLVYRCLARWSL